MIDWTRYGTTTPSKYRFTLSYVLHSENGVLELKNAPLEWADMELLLKRDSVTHGVYISAVVDSLTFIKEGKNLLQDIYASKGVFSQCDLYIYYLDHSTREYVSMPTSYKLDFNTYELVNLSKSTNGVKINCLETDIVSKFQQRKDTEVDLNKLVNIDGGSITPDSGVWKSLSIPALKINKTSRLATVGTGNLSGGSTGILYLYIPLTLGNSEITEAISQVGAALNTRDHDYAMIKDEVLFQTEEWENITNVRGTVYLHLTYVTPAVDSVVLGLSVTTPGDVETHWHPLQTYTSDYTGVKIIAVDDDIVVPEGSSLSLMLMISYSGAWSFNIGFDLTSITLTQLYLGATSVLAESWMIYKALQRNLQIILCQQFPFYSEFFGLTDVPYNLTGDCYPTESQLRFANILTGLNIRGGLLSDHTMPMKFSDLFKAIKAIWCVGGGFETLEDGSFRFRIEELAHFYQDDEALDLSSRINGIEIETEHSGDMMFLTLKSGYSKYEYEAIMGRAEYNTVNNRTTVVPNDNTFDNTCPLRADTRGMLALRLKPYSTTESEDVSGDEDIFIVKSQRASGYWISETDENITADDNTSLFAEDSLNLYLTPVRNLIRNGQIINAGLSYVPGTKLAYQTGDKNNSLKTTGEGYTVTENQDIIVDDPTALAPHLADPLWYPELLHLEIPFYEEDFVKLNAKPLGYLKLSEDYSGWIKEIKWKFAKNKATITLIRRIQA